MLRYSTILIVGFYLLRYVNPAIFSPEQYNLLPQGKVASPKARRNLVLITKVLQVQNRNAKNKLL